MYGNFYLMTIKHIKVRDKNPAMQVKAQEILGCPGEITSRINSMLDFSPAASTFYSCFHLHCLISDLNLEYFYNKIHIAMHGMHIFHNLNINVNV